VGSTLIFPSSFDSGEDAFWVRGPDEEFGLVIVLGDEADDIGLNLIVVRQLGGPDTVRREPVGFENALHRNTRSPRRL